MTVLVHVNIQVTMITLLCAFVETMYAVSYINVSILFQIRHVSIMFQVRHVLIMFQV